MPWRREAVYRAAHGPAQRRSDGRRVTNRGPPWGRRRGPPGPTKRGPPLGPTNRGPPLGPTKRGPPPGPPKRGPPPPIRCADRLHHLGSRRRRARPPQAAAPTAAATAGPAPDPKPHPRRGPPPPKPPPRRDRRRRLRTPLGREIREFAVSLNGDREPPDSVQNRNCGRAHHARRDRGADNAHHHWLSPCRRCRHHVTGDLASRSSGLDAGDSWAGLKSPRRTRPATITIFLQPVPLQISSCVC